MDWKNTNEHLVIKDPVENSKIMFNEIVLDYDQSPRMEIIVQGDGHLVNDHNSKILLKRNKFQL